MWQDYRHDNTRVSLINYHFVWIARRRKPVINGKIASRLKQLLNQKAAEVDIKIIALETRSDHFHLFANCPPTMAPNQIMYRLKGFSARVIRKEFPILMRLPSMWTTSYFCSTSGRVSSETIRKYIEAQSKL